MDWMKAIANAIDYMENNITEDLSVEEIAKHIHYSPFYFQKGFTLLCGLTISEYMRNRRLTLAASELCLKDSKVIDVALKYGYESSDSFTKAFTRFHGVTPTSLKKEGAMIKSFAPLKIKFILEGGYLMDYKMTEKDSFTVVGIARKFKYDTAMEEIPKLWEKYVAADERIVCGMYGISYDKNMGQDEFDYMIADNYDPSMDVTEGLSTWVIPKHTWAVFPIRGAMPMSLQEVNKKIFNEWLPAYIEYEIAQGYSIEMYDNPQKYAKGTLDSNYYAELWIPVKRKK